MNSTLEELWHGNISPQENSRNNTPEMKQLMEYMARHHESLLKSVTDEQKDNIENNSFRLTKMVSLFSGIGGFELGFQTCGIPTTLKATITTSRSERCIEILNSWRNSDGLSEYSELK